MNSASFNIEHAEPGNSTAESEKKNNRPPDTNFYQQRLPAWEPIHTAKSMLPTLLLLATYCIVIGVVLLTASEDIIEFSNDYTDCYSINSAVQCKDLRINMSRDGMLVPCTCIVEMNITKEMNGKIKMYYGLTNFFQNHKFYIKSRDDVQLNGVDRNVDTIATECAPYDTGFNETTNQTLPVAPCGAIANSYFNDSFTISTPNGDDIDITQQGIAWPTDSGDKFKNPASFENYTQPSFWNSRVDELDMKQEDNNGYLNEPFEVWMRTAAFSTFRKAYGILDSTKLEVGVYNITVAYNFPVTTYDGTKRIILTTTKWVGFKNNFLGIAHLVVGGVIFIVCLGLFYVQIKKKI